MSDLNIPKHLADNRAALIAAGIAPSPLADDPEGAAKLDKLTGALISDIQYYMQNNGGKMPDDVKIREMLGKQLMKVATPGRSWWENIQHGTFMPGKAVLGSAFEVEVPESFKTELQTKRAAAGLPPADDRKIHETYIQTLEPVK
jgi:hypothetical protein